MKHSLLTRDEKRAITFLLPGVLVTALLIIYPLVYIVSMSFSEDAMNMSGCQKSGCVCSHIWDGRGLRPADTLKLEHASCAVLLDSVQRERLE